ncbi:MAG: NADH-quinone reductase [Deltaproteobacteria bacterium]|nr:MAG: NADH-quinone reductase [Deltaproteobacteria bacterium]
MKRQNIIILFLLTLGMMLLLCNRTEANSSKFITKASFLGKDQIVISFAGPVDKKWAEDKNNYYIYEKTDPDIPLSIKDISLSNNGKTVTITFQDELNEHTPHIVCLKNIVSENRKIGSAILTVRKSYGGFLFSILIGAMLIHNFVFTKYLGLCVFFGTSRRKATAIGMGITFTIVMVISAMISWGLYHYVLKPLNLEFFQVVIFIGIVALCVQAVDTILRKVNPFLFKAFGIYLMLVLANCVILAVPLLIVTNDYNAMESFIFALGAGAGYLIALFLMSSVREKLELANVPPSYQGLSIAFIVAGLFGLAFMGFSGMSIF